VPNLLVTAKVVPLVPFEVYKHPAITSYPHLRLIAADHGGHIGFISRKQPRFWLDGLVVGWLQELSNKKPAAFVS
jgi:uncharacterized protein